MEIETLLTDMAGQGATNLYLSAGNPPLYRVDGTLCPSGGAPSLTQQDVETLLEPFLTPEQRKAAWAGSGIRRVRITRLQITVEGEMFPGDDCIAAAFHRVA